MTLTSPAFAAGARIPAAYTCHGAGNSPPLSWTGAPAATRAYALIGDDPDALQPGGFVHWVIYNIPASRVGLPENVARTARPVGLDGALQGVNDFGDSGFAGPCPPPGWVHHYHFRLYALDAPLALGPGATRTAVGRAISGHVVAQATLVGTQSGSWFALAINAGSGLLLVALLVRMIVSWLGAVRRRGWMRPAYWLTDWLIDLAPGTVPVNRRIDWRPPVAVVAVLAVRTALLTLFVGG